MDSCQVGRLKSITLSIFEQLKREFLGRFAGVGKSELEQELISFSMFYSRMMNFATS
jgi:hypothetical protein